MPKQHLYIVIKDGKDRYGIRKFDLLPDEGDHAAVRRPPPLLVRFKSPSSNFIAAVGSSKIMNMHPQEVPRPVVPVFDVRTLSLRLGPKHRVPLSSPMYLPVGDRLVALDDECASELLDPHSEETRYWSWGELPKTPFKPQDVAYHAAHPDGRTIFLSANNATYSIDTDEYKRSRWRLHGEWTLPFAGRAHFDPSLDAWVGLSGDPDTLGYLLCSCDVVPSTDPAESCSRSRQPPAWKLSKEKLFRDDLQAEKHVGASLVYMGVRTVCLVHYYSSVVEDDDGVALPRISRHRLEFFD